MINKGERPINIKDLVIEEPRTLLETAPFSIKIDIDEGTYQAVVRFINDEFMTKWSQHSGETACNLYALFPQRRNDFIKDYSLSDALLDWNRLSDTYQFQNKYCLKTIFPDVYNQLPENQKLLESKWNEIMTAISRGQEYSPDIEDLVYIRALIPNLVIPEKQNKNFEKLAEAFNLEELTYQVVYATALRILAPELFKKLNITGDFWKRSRALLNDFKKEKLWLGFAKLANQLNIISAQEIKFQNGEMIIVPPADLEDGNAVPLPEARRF